jgi:hypothetical protein
MNINFAETSRNVSSIEGKITGLQVQISDLESRVFVFQSEVVDFNHKYSGLKPAILLCANIIVLNGKKFQSGVIYLF